MHPGSSARRWPPAPMVLKPAELTPLSALHSAPGAEAGFRRRGRRCGRPRPRGRRAHPGAPGRGKGCLHRVDRCRASGGGNLRGDDQARDAGAGREVREHCLRRCGPREGGRGGARGGVRERGPGLLRPLADPGRESLHSTSSWLRSSRRSARCGWETRSTSRRQMGPLISADQREKVASYVNGGATVAIRGDAPEGSGFWFPPTVLCPVSNDDRVAREEIFGPVASVIPFRDEAEPNSAHPRRRWLRLEARSWTPDSAGRRVQPGARCTARSLMIDSNNSVRVHDAVRRVQAVRRRSRASAIIHLTTTPS